MFDPFSHAVVVIARHSNTLTPFSSHRDTDPANRLKAPNYYGYCPDAGRFQVMVFMTFMTVSHVLLKVLCCALMLRLNEIFFAIYMIGEMTIFFVIRVLRRDWRYWMPFKGLLSAILSVLIRVSTKLIVDYTLMVQFRHPFEIGGGTWSGNMLLNQIFCLVAAHLYSLYSEDGNNESFTKSTLWIVVIGLIILSALNFIAFVGMINKKYINTFFSFQTGQQFVVAYYQEGLSDDIKFKCFSHHRYFYEPIEGDLRLWLNENWDRWIEDRPAWFSAAAMARVPSDMLPPKYVASLGGLNKAKNSIKMSVVAEDKLKSLRLLESKMFKGPGKINPSQEVEGARKGKACIN